MKNLTRTAVLLIAALSLLCLSGCGRASRYEQAVTALESGDYESSAEYFEALGDYKDSPAQAESARQLAAKQTDYEKALDLVNGGAYDEAAELFAALDGYLDSAELASQCRRDAAQANYESAVKQYRAGDYARAEALFMSDPEYRDAGLYLTAIMLADCEVGDTVSFGNYIQDKDAETPAPIDWVVLSREEDRVLLLSEQGLDCLRFHDRLYPFWANSEMRQWLNGTFLAAAFTEGEQRLIDLSANTTRGYSSSLGVYRGGPDTEDAVFLLSKEELYEYLPEKADRICTPTPYALSAGAQTDDNGACPWWTRSPGDHYGQVCAVNADGVLDAYCRVYRTEVCVRPAIWVNFHKLTLE